MALFNEKEYLRRCLYKLALEIGPRPAGSPAHKLAAEFIEDDLTKSGYEIYRQEYPCPDWQALGCQLTVAGKHLNPSTNTYSPSCEVTAELVATASLDELREREITGKIAVLYRDLTAASFFPKNFDLFRDETQDEVIALLEQKQPAAVITVSPYPGSLPVLIEDHQFAIPSLTVSRTDGLTLLEKADSAAYLKISSQSTAGSGCNLIARRSGRQARKVLICAHYDTKPGTPGALDNGAGMAALLLLAGRLRQIDLDWSLELVAFGGEDSWYPGDAAYIREFPAGDHVAAVINLDGLGMKESNTAISFFNWPEEQKKRIMEIAGSQFVVEPFYESDHGFFWPLGIPTIAMTTSDYMRQLLGTVVHTEHDRPEIVDIDKLKQAVDLSEAIIWTL